MKIAKEGGRENWADFELLLSEMIKEVASNDSEKIDIRLFSCSNH